MQLSYYISNLLYRYDCVVVPDFGAFLAHKISAEVHENTNSFYPPKKRLSFNAQLQSNDGVLANHISEIEDISYENALSKIAKQVATLKKRLETKEKVYVQKIAEWRTRTTAQ